MLDKPIYYTIVDYLECKLTLWERIDAIDLLIDKMILQIGAAIDDGVAVTSEYSLDDGQIKLKAVNRSVTDVQAQVKALETMKQMYVNRLNGRQTVLRDISTLRR